jgi:hypothetical protein
MGDLVGRSAVGARAMPGCGSVKPCRGTVRALDVRTGPTEERHAVDEAGP